MIVALLSNNHKLYDLCKAILTETTLHSAPLLVLADPQASLPNADLYIWDCLPEFDTARRFATRDPDRHILVIERSWLASPAGPDLLGLKLVLKPVTKVALASWLSPAVAVWSSREQQPVIGQDRIISSLVEANIRLQEYEQNRSSFLARVTHDFRAPLTAMNGYCGMLLAGAFGPLTEIQREVLNRTLNSLKRLTRMSSAMLQLTSHSATTPALTLEEGNLHDCIQQAIHEIQPLITEKNIRVTVSLKPPPNTLHFDSGQLERVFTNLLDNACKFTPQRGIIEIRGYPAFWEGLSDRDAGLAGAERGAEKGLSPNAFRVDVCNTGPLISAERLTCIFDEYTSYGEGSNALGSGLGLAICKLIVQEHRGGIWAENHAGGPAVSFVLPLEHCSHNGVIPRNGHTMHVGLEEQTS